MNTHTEREQGQILAFERPADLRGVTRLILKRIPVAEESVSTGSGQVWAYDARCLVYRAPYYTHVLR